MILHCIKISIQLPSWYLVYEHFFFKNSPPKCKAVPYHLQFIAIQTIQSRPNNKKETRKFLNAKIDHRASNYIALKAFSHLLCVARRLRSYLGQLIN